MGPGGALVNIGPRGAYLNTGLPGTGLYDRQRIGGGSAPARAAASSDLEIRVGIDDEGRISIKDSFGDAITRASALARIRRAASFKEEASRLTAEFQREREAKNVAFIDIHRRSPALVCEIAIQASLRDLMPEVCAPRPFPSISRSATNMISKGAS